MKSLKCLIFLLTFVFFSNNLIAQSGERSIGTGSTPAIKELSAVEAQTDFDILRKSLEEAHGGLYRYSTKANLDRLFENYRQELNHPISQLELIGILSQMLAEIRDGHLRLEYDEATTSALGKARVFPFRVFIEGSRLMVMFNDTPHDSTIQPGMEIVAINGKKSADLIRFLLSKISGDGFIETGKKRRLERTFGQNYWLFIDQSDEFTITARDTAGKEVTEKIAGILPSDRENNRKNNPVNSQIQSNLTEIDGAKENISLRFFKDPEIAALRIRGFDGQDYPTSLNTVFQTLQEKKTKVLILDLRGNGGGVDEYGALLVSQFTEKSFRYFDRIHLTSTLPSFATWKPNTSEDLKKGVIPDSKGGYLVTDKLHKGVGEQQSAATPFLGKLIVLLDGNTFSTAADVTAILHNIKRASFIGEESGGGYEGNTSGLNAQITLPNSKLRLKITMYDYWNAVTPNQKGRGTQPDFFVENSLQGLLRGVDAQLEQAIALARKNL